MYEKPVVCTLSAKDVGAGSTKCTTMANCVAAFWCAAGKYCAVGSAYCTITGQYMLKS